MTNYTGLIDQQDSEFWVPSAEGNEIIAIVIGSLTALALLFVLVTTVLFYRASRHSEFMRQRSHGLTILISVSVFFYILVAGSSNTRQNIGYPCFVQLWGVYICCITHAFSFTTKVLRFLFMVQFNKDKLGIKPQNIAPSSKEAGGPFAVMDVKSNASAPLNRPSTQKQSSLVANVANRNGFFNRWLSKNKWFFLSEGRVTKLVFALVGLVMIYVLIIQIVDKSFTIIPTATLCYFGWQYAVMLTILLGNSLILLPYCLTKLWHAKDGYGIRQELIACCILLAIGSAITIIWGMAPGPQSNVFSTMSWISISFLVLHAITVAYPVYQIHYSNEHQYTIANSADPEVQMLSTHSHTNQWRAFLNMLSDPVGLAQLKIWSAQFFCTELIIFIEEYQDLKKFLASTYPPPPRPGAENKGFRNTMLTVASPITTGPSFLKRQSSSVSLVLATNESEYSVPLTPVSPRKVPLGQHPLSSPTCEDSLIAGSTHELKPISEKYTFIDIDHPSEIVPSIRDTWNITPSEPSTSQFSASRTSLSTNVPSNNLDVVSHPSLQLAYFMFYQRFIEESSDLKVNVSHELTNLVEARALMGDFSADIFDDVRQDVLKALFRTVYVKCMK
ncbi:hypothetical protein BJ085DRAFT_29473 [Dimargaris cristalligena]|uniref:RGS domain-containing protein n=1 Tax=Dimargaris cristalligena TaxID=215637 RepID=A0A4V1J4G5_9FUNG|nr:hypothetical protein BJ085DRAFT_29473 [Dimargaris cristalligena]|eukprot:RKP35479.1 hypothetical protein BJ085DRAFT_29473 [Dimargaris cristalligena]